MDDKEKSQEIMKTEANTPMTINLGQNNLVDLTGLSKEDAMALQMQYAEGMVDIRKKALELKVDTEILKETLNTLADTTREVDEAGNAVTISHTQTSKVGRTEIMMGNTQKAATGKLSKSQTGERDWTPYYIFGGMAVAIIIALLLRSQ